MKSEVSRLSNIKINKQSAAMRQKSFPIHNASLLVEDILSNPAASRTFQTFFQNIASPKVLRYHHITC
jgi:hypothetical protein